MGMPLRGGLEGRAEDSPAGREARAPGGSTGAVDGVVHGRMAGLRKAPSVEGDRVPSQTEGVTIELSAELSVLRLCEAACALYGLDEASVRGRPLGDVLLTDAGRIDWEAHWAAVLAGKPFEQVMLHRSCSGLRIWVYARLEAQARGVRLRARRASGREVLEQQPGGVVGALEKMLAVGGVGLWMNDWILERNDWSEHACALHGVPPGTQVSPSLLFGLFHPDDRAQTAAEIQRAVAEGIPYDRVARVRNGATDYRHLRVFGGVSYDSEGLALISVGGVQDVSEQIALRARVRELEDQLRAAQRGDVVGRLAGGIAHDFNNILMGILGCCEMLVMGELSVDQKSDVQQIRTATLRAADLTRQLLAFGRRQALRRRVVAPAQVLEDVLSLLRRTVPENVELRLSSAETAGQVLVDVTQLHQVLTNLVVNAAQAMPSGGRIEIGAAQVALSPGDVASERAGPYIRFAVEDTGPGVPREIRQRIFEPFFSTKPPGQGSGLGLSVVQGIVEQHDGHILIREGSLGGARFEVYLPVTEHAADSPSAVPPGELAPSEGGKRVLLVEDEQMVRELTKRILVAAGFEVTDASDAGEALTLAADGAFDVLLTDVVLPAMSGPDMVARLRERGLAFRVVYMSGYPADFVESRVQLGPNELLVQKPFTVAALLLALRQVSL
jgi:two-component system, cell cycle sensor histidine kinase and response regulator CckA